MIRINGRWHYEPNEGDLSFMELKKELYRSGRDWESMKGKPLDELLADYIKIYGAGPVPVPSTTMITVRNSAGRII